WAEAELLHGSPGAALAPLIELAGEQPLTESVAALLMRVLHATGRTAEALECYGRIRRRLADELGTDPGAARPRAHIAILRSDPATDGAPDWSGGAVPAQLPPDVYGFAGRAEQLRLLDQLVTRAADQQPTAVVIPVVSGAAGVGKTALALHWAHRAAPSFPDG